MRAGDFAAEWLRPLLRQGYAGQGLIGEDEIPFGCAWGRPRHSGPDYTDQLAGSWRASIALGHWREVGSHSGGRCFATATAGCAGLSMTGNGRGGEGGERG